jgi:hypothetical protein
VGVTSAELVCHLWRDKHPFGRLRAQPERRSRAER